MTDVAIGAADERRRFLRIKILVVNVIRKSRFPNRVGMAFDARFILDLNRDHRGLMCDARVMLERVPRGKRDNGRASRKSFAAVTINTTDLFFAVMKRGEIIRRLRIRACESRQIFALRLCVARRAETIVLLLVRHEGDSAGERKYNNQRAEREKLQAERVCASLPPMPSQALSIPLRSKFHNNRMHLISPIRKRIAEETGFFRTRLRFAIVRRHTREQLMLA